MTQIFYSHVVIVDSIEKERFRAKIAKHAKAQSYMECGSPVPLFFLHRQIFFVVFVFSVVRYSLDIVFPFLLSAFGPL